MICPVAGVCFQALPAGIEATLHGSGNQGHARSQLRLFQVAFVEVVLVQRKIYRQRIGCLAVCLPKQGFGLSAIGISMHRLFQQRDDFYGCLAAEQRAYFMNQRGTMAARLCEATGLVAEQRAEGLALADEDGELTDVAMPAEGTEAHVTLLVAEFLSTRAATGVSEADVAAFIAVARRRFGSYWRKSAREAGSEQELAAAALERLRRLQLVVRDGAQVRALPALARFAVGEARIKPATPGATGILFD